MCRRQSRLKEIKTADGTTPMKGKTMSEITVHSITFSKMDDDGNEILNKDGSVKMFTTNDNFDHSLICDLIDDDDLEEC